MSWDGAMDQLAANLTLAAGDLAKPIKHVREGEPDALTQDQIAFWASGSRQSRTGGNTLSKVNLERGVDVTAYLRGSVRSGASLDPALERRLVEVEEALFVRLWADADLNGNAIGIDIGDSEYGWTLVGGQLARTVTFTVWVDLPEVATISL